MTHNREESTEYLRHVQRKRVIEAHVPTVSILVYRSQTPLPPTTGVTEETPDPAA